MIDMIISKNGPWIKLSELVTILDKRINDFKIKKEEANDNLVAAIHNVRMRELEDLKKEIIGE